MKTMTLKSRGFPFLAGVLLTLATVFTEAGLVSAQMHGECLTRTGVTPPPDPTVTAQQVEDGSATLAEFALAVRTQMSTFALTLPEQVTYLGCLRETGSPYRAGSTYFVQLMPDGRIFANAGDMSLSGRLIKPEVYGAILQAVGITSPADFADPARITAALMGTGGMFDVSDVPGASGYAFMYPQPDFLPISVMLAGFDLDESHLVQEEIDYGNPSITASDVVDRATLQAFVTQAGQYLLDINVVTDPTAASRARIAMRDPNGPWRDDPVYLYALDLTTNVIFFHGAFPDRFEFRPLIPTLRDAVTQQLVLPQVLKAAQENEEGGFVEYHWDDPTDDSDRADIPKTGYARMFTAYTSAPDGTQVPLQFIVGSGFYGDPASEVAERSNAVIKSVLPQVMRAMTASTVDAVSGRIESAHSDSAPQSSMSFAGASTLTEAVKANGLALGKGELDLGRLLANSSFTKTLNMAEGGGGGPFSQLTFWGSADYRDLEGGSPMSVNYDGDVTSAHLGVDTRLGENLLAGVALMHAQGSMDYTTSNGSGDMTTDLTSITPYVGLQLAASMNLWAMVGYGEGEVEIDDFSVAKQKSDLEQQMVAVGLSGSLISTDALIPGGTTKLNFKAEVAYTSADVDGSGNIESMSLNTGRQRLMFEGEHVQQLASGATFTPSLELGLRNDAGDGESGTGIEAGGALRYADAASGLTVEGRVRTLLDHSGDSEETGVSGMVKIAPDRSGHGLALVTRLSWGQTDSGVHQLWKNGVTAGVSSDNRAHLNTEIGYGLGMADGLGVVTPFAGLGLAGEGSQWWRLGTRWQVAQALSMSLEGSRDEAGYEDGPEHRLMLQGTLNW